MEQGGGMVPLGWLATQAPQFVLYGDGSFVLRPATDADRPDAWIDGLPRFLQGRLTEDYVQALLGFALTTGRVHGAREGYPQNRCADCGSTIFTLNAAGVSKTVTVDALGIMEESGPDATDRRGFAELAATLTGLEERARSGELGEVVLYDPEVYRVTLIEALGEPVAEPVAWPWSDISPNDFRAPAEFAPPTLVMTREDVALLTDVPSGGHNGIWVEEADATPWQIGLRPLLPHEIAADTPAER